MEYLASAQATVSSFPTVFVIAAVVLIILFGLIAWRKNRRFIATAIAFYPAALLYLHLPYTDRLIVAESTTAAYINKVVIFVILAFLIYLVVHRFTRRHTGSTNGYTKTLTALGVALSLVIEGFLVITTIIPVEEAFALSPMVINGFSQPFVFIWMLVPAAILYGVSYL